MGLAKSRSSDSAAGFSLVEVLIATMLLATALVMLAQLFALSTQSNIGARNTTYTAVLAQQKLEELRALTWGFDTQGLPISDTSTNTAVSPETPADDNNPLTRPNNDGPMRRLPTGVTFGTAATLEFWPDGTVHQQSGSTLPWPVVGVAGTSVTLVKGSVTKRIDVNGVGKITLVR